MDYKTFLRNCINPFKEIEHEYVENRGYIVWRRGTGDNVELLHIRTFKKGEGHGRKLFYKMLDRLSKRPPYHSVFGFTHVGNSEARLFYGALGFWLRPVVGIYQEGSAILFCQSYKTLCKRMHQFNMEVTE